MATYNPPHRAKLAGIPGQSADDMPWTPDALITGDLPAVMSVDKAFAANQTVAAYTPVMEDGGGNLVPATQGTPAIGITFFDVVVGAEVAKAPIYPTGCFNPALLNWDVSYATDAQKLAAFEGAETPTAIVLKAVKTGSVVLP